MMNMCLVVVCQIWLMFVSVSGLRLSFAPFPDTVNQLSTDPQRLSCAIHQNPGDNVHITSIVISRANNDTSANETVALVTAYASAHATAADPGMKVSGDVKPGQPAGEFLSIEWPQPQDAVLGEYYCEVFGLDQVGHPVEFSKPSLIDAPELTLRDAIKYISILQQKQGNMKTMIDDIKKNCSCLRSGGAPMMSGGDQSQLTKRLEDAEQKIMQLESTSSAHSSLPMTSRHVENGFFSCGPVQPKTIRGRFAKGFNSEAKMIVSLHGLETHGSSGSKVEVTPTNDGTTYSISCGTNSNVFANGTWIAFE